VKAPFDDTMTTWEKFSWDNDLKVFDLDREIVTQTNFRQQRNAFYYDYLSTILEIPLKSDLGTPLRHQIFTELKLDLDRPAYLPIGLEVELTRKSSEDGVLMLPTP
jgi:hypothetical protein